MVEADLVGPLKAKKVDLFHAWVAWVGAVYCMGRADQQPALFRHRSARPGRRAVYDAFDRADLVKDGELVGTVQRSCGRVAWVR